MNGGHCVPTHHRVNVMIGAQDQRCVRLLRAILVFPIYSEARPSHQTFSRLYPIVVHHRLLPPAYELVLAIVKDEALVEVIHTTIYLDRVRDSFSQVGLPRTGRTKETDGVLFPGLFREHGRHPVAGLYRIVALDVQKPDHLILRLDKLAVWKLPSHITQSRLGSSDPHPMHLEHLFERSRPARSALKHNYQIWMEHSELLLGTDKLLLTSLQSI